MSPTLDVYRSVPLGQEEPPGDPVNRLTSDAQGFVVRGRFEHRHARTGETIVSYSWWHGPDRVLNGWGPLDYSVHVFATEAEAHRSARQRLGRRIVEVLEIPAAIAVEIGEVAARRERAVASKRTDVAIACSESIARLRALQR